ncbi:MAG: nitroreductase family protein [Planctomycetes bacterium]|nr:nitroreductase family protein [Planctomycetota bacterium]
MEVLEAIKNRRSVRSYATRPIPPDVFARLRQALRYAPSACNYQPWHFVLVTDEQLRGKVAQASAGQHWMADAPVIVAACCLPEQAYPNMGGTVNSGAVDVAIALDHLTLAAVAEGLGTCWIGAFDEGQVKRVLGIPATVRLVALTPLGYPASPDLNHPVDESRRKPQAEIFSSNRYGSM